MKAHAEVNNPGTVEVSITLTMPLADWKVLRGQLEAGKWPSYQLSMAITDVVAKIEGRVYHEPESK